jgi:peroxiredoxin
VRYGGNATPVILDAQAAEFRLPATDGKTYALDDVAGKKGTVVVFICNHCPYVKAVIDRMVADARALMSEGIGFEAICSNDAASYRGRARGVAVCHAGCGGKCRCGRH